MTEQELKAIEERAAKVPPVVLDEEVFRVAYRNGGLGALIGKACCDYVGPHHEEFVVRVVNDAVGIAARTDVPALVVEVRRLREQVQELQTELNVAAAEGK